MKRTAGTLFLVIAGVLAARAQTPAADALRSDSPPRSDSLIRDVSADTSSVHATATKSPGIAMLCSALLPGAGQFYNESYWKVPVVLGLGVYFAAEWLHNNRVASDYRERYSASLATGNGDESLRRLRDFYKDQRDTFAWYFVILYAANILDAYVDASLYGFDISPDLSARVGAAGTEVVPVVRFAIRF